jgi:hypothetical protein
MVATNSRQRATRKQSFNIRDMPFIVLSHLVSTMEGFCEQNNTAQPAFSNVCQLHLIFFHKNFVSVFLPLWKQTILSKYW